MFIFCCIFIVLLFIITLVLIILEYEEGNTISDIIKAFKLPSQKKRIDILEKRINILEERIKKIDNQQNPNGFF